MNDIFEIKIASKAVKQLKKLPLHIALKLQIWVDDVGFNGLSIARKRPSYHDEALQGKRNGQRSIRLNRQYRAIYVVNKKQQIKFIEITEVNKHEY
ncbi:MAG: hypothetical protein AAGA27_06740 [Pseudomonadota bacterium]